MNINTKLLIKMSVNQIQQHTKIVIHNDQLGFITREVEDCTMPFHPTVNSMRETPPKSKLRGISVFTVEEQENETPPATSSETEQPKEEPEKEEREEKKSLEETKKDEKDHYPVSQIARAKKQIPMASSHHPKILTGAIKTCFQKSGASVVKGKGASRHFIVVQKSRQTPQKSRNRKNRSSAADPEPQVKLEDILPLGFICFCDPKEASYGLIRKYMSQCYPKLRVAIGPQLLKNALQRAVERGQLEQITGKGAYGTFQLKKSEEKPLLARSLMEYAIFSAIVAMNEPKTCCTTVLKKYVMENHPGINSNYQTHLLKKTLQKCKKNRWTEQISGKGYSGNRIFLLSSLGVLFPKKELDDSGDEYEEEDDSSEEDSDVEEPPPKRKLTHKAEGPSLHLKSQLAQQGKARPLPKKAHPKAKTPAKKVRPSSSVIKKPSGGSSKKPAASVTKEVKLPGKGKATMMKSFKSKK
ncbi:unnamed protein product [Nyctereutes procyonoides]|uniref:Heterochromatin protein 1-binding protein 3 n=1 Tax=Nyctereutes procyonoides TaxID=34880 RepID=A0A811YM55_NYCPR|nr:unnamed protein product [Nyctereutes procyonoides]